MEITEIRRLLQECENSILFAVFERSRWRANPEAYRTNGKTGAGGSLFTSLLADIEKAHAKAGRYGCPEEHPFTNPVIDTDITPRSYQINDFLATGHQAINVNSQIIDAYFLDILPQITREGSDENLGSAVMADINLLQAISRRIHLGKLVAQVKYNQDPEWYGQKHSDGELYGQLTNDVVEKAILTRLAQKLDHLNQDNICNFPTIQLNSEKVVAIYQDFVIPLTKRVQVEYFKHLLVKY